MQYLTPLYFNEWRYILRQPIALLSILLPAVFAYMLAMGLDTGDSNKLKQFEFNLIAWQMLCLPVLVAALAPGLFLKDNIYNMRELIVSTHTSYLKRTFSRITLLISLCLLISIISYSAILISYSLQNETNLSLDFNYLKSLSYNLFLMVFPSLILLASIALILCTVQKSIVVVYAFFGALWLSYLMIASMTGSPILAGSSIVNTQLYDALFWFDPFAITASMSQFESSGSSQWLEGVFVSRAFYIALSASIIYWSLFKYNSELVSTKNKTNKGKSQKIKLKTYKQIKAPNKFIYSLTTPMFTLCKTPLQQLLASKLTLLILLSWVILIFNTAASGLNYAEPFSILNSNSIDALNRVSFDVLPVLGAFLVALWSWQITTRESAFNFSQLVAATPIKNNQLILGHVFVICFMVFILLVLTAIGCVLAQLFFESEFYPVHYIKQLSLSGLPLMLLGSLFVAIFHLCRSNLTAGFIISLILLVKFTPVMSNLGLTHTLWQIADSPLQEPDSFWGYQNSLSVFWPYMKVWLLVVPTTILCSFALTHRGTGLMQIKTENFPKVLFIPIFISLFSISDLHYKLLNEKPLMTSDKREAFKAQYETQYAVWKTKPQPSIVHIDADVAIFPEQQIAKFKLNYQIKNKTNTEITQVLIGRSKHYPLEEVHIKGAHKTHFDKKLNQAVFTFDKPLKVGESTSVETKFTFEQPKLWPIRSHQIVSADFSYLRSVPLLPTIGYQKNYELTAQSLREDYNLADNSHLKPSELFKQPHNSVGNYEFTTIKTRLSTKLGYQGIGQGKLTKQWQQDNRSFFEFETADPIRAIPTWMSVPFSAISKDNNKVALNVYTPRKNQAADINLKAMDDTLNWFNEIGLPYSGSQLNIIAVPDFGPTGYALPQLMLISDSVGFRAQPSENAAFDQRYRRAVHETAHQWFGHQVGNGVHEDNAFLIESMAKYVELVLIENHYGKAAMQSLVEYETTRYEHAKRNNIQAPIALVDATLNHDQYSRATMVFSQLREVLGDEIITEAINLLFTEHAYPLNPATSMDFVRKLKQVANKNTEFKNSNIIDELLLQPV